MSSVYIENVPNGSQVGIDLLSWTTGPNFRGIREIPRGLHCLHITINGIMVTKFATWFQAGPSLVLAYKWDRTTEALVSLDTGYITSGHGINPMFLLDGSGERDSNWERNSGHLSLEVVQSIVPLGAVVVSTTSSNTDASHSDLKNLESTADYADEIEFRFLPIDLKRSWKPGSLGRDITRMSLDKSWLLEDSISRAGGEASFLGQFEFCFLSVLLFTSITAFEQWNIMLRLVCSCRATIPKMQAFYTAFLNLLQAQIEQVPEELYADIFELTLPRSLYALKSNLADISEDDPDAISSKVRDNLDSLIAHHVRNAELEDDHAQLQAVYPSDEAGYEARKDESEDDDEAPVVVEL
ncbi:protein of unknown function [Taphrina deformans PYCC 5710]|uniref:A1 cistron-splicing factor AAR2 n=1 Tax=Taphrina deformans (strain PYCC 5710 / ATCC 11124 / CBS 356.35 / IMI 108563 / JCM 9778 / NBRC 8474) TaxID=1097556 RepID=R4XF12_TAPDE|nr:protein of unknown function [Taphrina deformans PYCC 5710]|eukprot:CCG84371.1 protein of unknown function [Taphrina deformans PYCC 5710]